jgi:hypothetical protein
MNGSKYAIDLFANAAASYLIRHCKLNCVLTVVSFMFALFNFKCTLTTHALFITQKNVSFV